MVKGHERVITLEKAIKKRSEEIIPNLKAKKIKSNNYTRSYRVKINTMCTQFNITIII